MLHEMAAENQETDKGSDSGQDIPEPGPVLSAECPKQAVSNSLLI